jgi:hypothetical protein
MFDPAPQVFLKNQGLFSQLPSDQIFSADCAVEGRPAGARGRARFFDGVRDRLAHVLPLLLAHVGAPLRSARTSNE